MDLIGTEIIVQQDGNGTVASFWRSGLIVEGKVLGTARRRLVLERVAVKKKGQH
jgi:hypothetical protein